MTHRAFYAEMRPLPKHSSLVDYLYVMRDCGIMTADQQAFASPLLEIAFLFRDLPDGAGCAPRTVVVEPSFGHRRKSRPFHGWAFGIKCRPILLRRLPTDTPEIANCQARLNDVLGTGQPMAAAVQVLDRLCAELAPTAINVGARINRSSRTVGELASQWGRCARTVHRQVSAATGLPPKRLLSVERFRQTVHAIPDSDVKLSAVADDLGFADQSHLTREFKRHAGLPPGTFQRTWSGFRGQTVRFVQDDHGATRITMAVLAMDSQGDAKA